MPGCAASCKSRSIKTVFSRAARPGESCFGSVKAARPCAQPGRDNREVSYENAVCPVPCGGLYAAFWLAMMGSPDIFSPIRMMMGPMGIFGPILLVLLGLWMGRGKRSPWYVKAALLALLAVLLLIMFGYL